MTDELRSARVADATGNWVGHARAAVVAAVLAAFHVSTGPIGSWLPAMPAVVAALAAGVINNIGQLPLIIALFFIGAFAMPRCRLYLERHHRS